MVVPRRCATVCGDCLGSKAHLALGCAPAILADIAVVVRRDLGWELVRLASDWFVEVAVRRGLATVVAHLRIVPLLVDLQQVLPGLGSVCAFHVFLALRLHEMRAFLSDRSRVILPLPDELMRLSVVLLIIEGAYLVAWLELYLLLTSSFLVVLVPAEGFEADFSALVELFYAILQAHLVGRKLIG